MHRLLCFIGFHHWEHHVNRQKGGAKNGWDTCSRCGHEKPSSVFDDPGFTGNVL